MSSVLWGASGGAHFYSETLEKPGAVGWECREEDIGAGWLGLCPLPIPMSHSCVLSGPRLRPRQKESRKPTKVSPLAPGWGPLTPQGLGGEAQFLLLCSVMGIRKG